MNYKIISSYIAKITLHQNTEYLKKEWTFKEVQNFINKIKEITIILKKDPFVFQKWEHNTTIRKIKVVKQVTLFYVIEGETVEILLFWNNYKNPDDLKELL